MFRVRGAFTDYVDKMRLVNDTGIVNYIKIFPFNSKEIILPIEIISNKAKHNLMDAKCRWRFNRLDVAVSFRNP